MICAALASTCAAWNSPSVAMILARFSRSASACLARARTMDSASCVLEFNGPHLDAPRFRLPIDDCLQLAVDLFAAAQKLVEARLSKNGTQRGLRNLGGRL